MKALSSGLFEQVISVEVNDELVTRGLERFRLMVATGLLHLVHDDSANLGKHICKLQHPITFFLDAHGYWVQERRVAENVAFLHNILLKSEKWTAHTEIVSCVQCPTKLAINVFVDDPRETTKRVLAVTNLSN